MMDPAAGDVWLVDLDPIVGHEQAGTRPVVVVSGNRYNRWRHGFRIVVPITSRDRQIPTHVPITPPAGGLRNVSFAITEQPRAVDLARFRRKWGVIDSPLLEQLREHVREFLTYD